MILLRFGAFVLLLASVSLRCLSAEDKGFDQFWADTQKPNLADKSEVSRQRLQWWHDAKFGMFLHWDPSSVAATEISWSKQFYDDTGEHLLDNPRPGPGLYNIHEHHEWLSWFRPAAPREVYDNLYKSFYPGMFDADQFVAQAKKAGMKYIIEVSKHHNGFCMWDTNFSDYNIMHSPFHRDILGEIAQACDRAGMKFGIYYSQRDWHHPDYCAERMEQYDEYMYNQIQELLTQHPNISVIFFDTEPYYPAKLWNTEKLFRMIYHLRPDIVINDRCGVPGDYSTPEQSIGKFNSLRDWESCMTFTGHWSWSGFGNAVIPFEQCLLNLVHCAGGNGNLLMNVGPMPTGQIDPREADRLSRVGAWLAKNGESIYSTHGGPFRPGPYGVSTCRDNTVYVHGLKWNNDTIVLPPLPAKIKSSHLLSGGRVEVSQNDQGITLTVAKADQCPPDTVVAIELDQPATTLQPSLDTAPTGVAPSKP
jgi:alpha-L-fucosidase